MTFNKIFKALGNRFMRYLYYPIVGVFRDSQWRIPGIRVERIGSTYGGGWIATDSLNDQSIAYSFGIGCDITFDEMLIRRTGCRVIGFDPTPRSAEWIKNNVSIPPSFTFVPVGLANLSGRRKLYLQSNPDFVSGSIVKNLEGGFVECDFLSLRDIMGNQQHTSVDLIKMDIEGAEYAILEQWIREGFIPPVRQLWIEFHPSLADYTTQGTAQLIKRLEGLSLKVVKRAFVQNPNHYLLFNTAFPNVISLDKSGK